MYEDMYMYKKIKLKLKAGLQIVKVLLFEAKMFQTYMECKNWMDEIQISNNVDVFLLAKVTFYVWYVFLLSGQTFSLYPKILLEEFKADMKFGSLYIIVESEENILGFLILLLIR